MLPIHRVACSAIIFMVTTVAARGESPATQPSVPVMTASPFELDQVRLLDGPFKRRKNWIKRISSRWTRIGCFMLFGSTWGCLPPQNPMAVGRHRPVNFAGILWGITSPRVP